MNRLRLTLTALLIGLLPAGAVGAAVTALVADQLIDGVSDQASGYTVVLVEGEQIVAVGNRDIIPPSAEVIELDGMTLMPGMINAHEHPQLYADDYQNAHLQASSAYKTLRSLAALQSWLLAGWTTVRVMGDGDVYYGNMDLKRAIDEGLFTAPRLTGAAPLRSRRPMEEA